MEHQDDDRGSTRTTSSLVRRVQSWINGGSRFSNLEFRARPAALGRPRSTVPRNPFFPGEHFRPGRDCDTKGGNGETTPAFVPLHVKMPGQMALRSYEPGEATNVGLENSYEGMDYSDDPHQRESRTSSFLVLLATSPEADEPQSRSPGMIAQTGSNDDSTPTFGDPHTPSSSQSYPSFVGDRTDDSTGPRAILRARRFRVPPNTPESPRASLSDRSSHQLDTRFHDTELSNSAEPSTFPLSSRKHIPNWYKRSLPSSEIINESPTPWRPRPLTPPHSPSDSFFTPQYSYLSPPSTTLRSPLSVEDYRLTFPHPSPPPQAPSLMPNHLWTGRHDKGPERVLPGDYSALDALWEYGSETSSLGDNWIRWEDVIDFSVLPPRDELPPPTPHQRKEIMELIDREIRRPPKNAR
ncbi:hypothetical protein P7C73_g4102, partial [Tremellales sp. Uapishka_1]